MYISKQKKHNSKHLICIRVNKNIICKINYIKIKVIYKNEMF